MDGVTSFGAWVQQHRKALHLTQAALAQQVGCAVVTIKKIEQELRRPSPEMAELLADQLAVAATDRPQFLAMARGQMLDVAPNGSNIALPPFLQNPQQRPPPRFVARSAEMDHLHRQLRQALAGKVQIAFIRGEAGRGKTSLLQAFAQQAQRDVPDLIVAEGTCSAHVGQGDPFLPVRDLFDMLTGDIEAHWQANTLALDQARRLWRFVPAVTQTLLDEGVDLFGILVSPSALYIRLKAHSAAQFTGLDRLRQMSQQPLAPRLDQTQAQLFEQITRVLAALSGAKPLLLLLDDLQWIDETSLALLFHLSRRLVAQRIMIVATYRGSEVTDTHPLQTTVTELTRRFGDIVLDLEENDAWHNRLFF
ncbi:MAG: AAA family ATPase, partial [Anaerolineae bacterium]|nr:AAA family ATPase [Anaerolineae bacterium]